VRFSSSKSEALIQFTNSILNGMAYFASILIIIQLFAPLPTFPGHS